MSKPIARVVFSVLIALVLVAGIYTSVQGAMLNASTKSAQAYIDAGVNLGLSRHRNSVPKLDSFGAPADTYDQSGRDCKSESGIDPDG